MEGLPSDDADTKSIRDGSSIGCSTTALPIRFHPIVLLGNPLEKMLQSEGRSLALNESVEVSIVAQRQAGHQGAAGSEASFLQVFNGSKKFVRLTRLFIPPHMLQGGDADDQIILLLRDKLDDVLIHDTRSDLILVDDVMVNGIIVGKDIAELENPLVSILHQKFAEDRDFHRTLVFPGLVVHVVQVLVCLTVELESLGPDEAGQPHLHETPVSPE